MSSAKKVIKRSRGKSASVALRGSETLKKILQGQASPPGFRFHKEKNHEFR